MGTREEFGERECHDLIPWFRGCSLTWWEAQRGVKEAGWASEELGIGSGAAERWLGGDLGQIQSVA